MTKLKTLIVTAAAFGALTSIQMPVSAQEATPWTELMMRAADGNKDGTMTKEEFLGHMAKLWDEKHASMRKTDGTMKTAMTDKTQFVRVIFVDPGKIGG